VKKKTTSLPSLTLDSFLIDSHCHLDMDTYRNDLDTILEQAHHNHIRAIITIGIDIQSSQQAISLAKQHNMIKATIGIHPHDVGNIHPQTLNILADLAEKNRSYVVGYGEIGLDYTKNYAPPDIQRRHFCSQLALAKDLHLPVIIHDRDAHDDILRILQQAAPFPSGGVMHCFSGDIKLAQKVLDLGFKISISGVVTFKNAAELQAVAQLIPLSAILLETDGPFLTPVPWRGKRNEPAFLLHTAQKIAELREISINEIARQTSANTIKLFQLSADLQVEPKH
jgi:TatD DNase family protein